MATKYWLMKSEADVYSIDDLKKDKKTMWDGVRNYQARNNMREMKKGDRVLYYHSRQTPPSVVGLATVVKEAYPDPTQFEKKNKYFDAKSDPQDRRWWLVDIRYEKKFSDPVALEAIKGEAKLSDMVLVNNSRLSVQPVKKAEFDRVLRMAGEQA